MTTRELISAARSILEEPITVYARIELLGGPYDGLFLYLPDAEQEHAVGGYLYVKTGVGIDGKHVFSYRGRVAWPTKQR